MMTAILTHHKLSVDRFHQMAEAGILSADDRIELIQGELIDMMPIGRKHAATVDRLTFLFYQLLGDRVHHRAQNPLVLDDRTEVYPDVLLLQRRADFYAFGHPVPTDVYLVVEVADSTLLRDQTVKLPLYAAAKIPEVWIVNLVSDRVEVYRQPVGNEYRQVLNFAPGDTLRLLAFPELEISVADFIAPA